MQALVSLVVLVVAVAVAAGVRSRAQSGIMGRREAYGRLLSDWAGLSALGLGMGLAVLIAGVRWLAYLLLVAVLAESFIVLHAVRPPRRRR